MAGPRTPKILRKIVSDIIKSSHDVSLDTTDDKKADKEQRQLILVQAPCTKLSKAQVRGGVFNSTAMRKHIMMPQGGRATRRVDKIEVPKSKMAAKAECGNDFNGSVRIKLREIAFWMEQMDGNPMGLRNEKTEEVMTPGEIRLGLLRVAKKDLPNLIRQIEADGACSSMQKEHMISDVRDTIGRIKKTVSFYMRRDGLRATYKGAREDMLYHNNRIYDLTTGGEGAKMPHEIYVDRIKRHIKVLTDSKRLLIKTLTDIEAFHEEHKLPETKKLLEDAQQAWDFVKDIEPPAYY